MKSSGLDVGALSHPGLVRDHNEDYYGYFVPSDSEVLERKGCLYVVADGMGGNLAGEVASEQAVHEVLRAYYAHPSDDVAEALEAAFQRAHEQILEEAERRRTQGMGTTAVAAVVKGGRLTVANTGDSPAYLIRNGEIETLSEEHSWVAMAVQEGLISPDQAATYPHRNVITRSLGMEKPMEVFVADERALLLGDAVLLCSDGLNNVLSPAEMAELGGDSTLSSAEAAERLVNLVLERGAPDNVTVLLLRVDKPPSRPSGAGRGGLFPMSRLTLTLVVISFLLLAALAALLAFPREAVAPGSTSPVVPAVRSTPSPLDGSTTVPPEGTAGIVLPPVEITETLSPTKTPDPATPLTPERGEEGGEPLLRFVPSPMAVLEKKKAP